MARPGLARLAACLLAVVFLTCPAHARPRGPRQGSPIKSASVDAAGLRATERLINTLYTETRPRTAGGDPGGAAASVPNAQGLHRQAGDLLETLSRVRPALMARQPKGRASGSGGRSPSLLLGSSVNSAEEQFANGVANLLTATGAARALQITGVPPEWEAKEGREKLCNDAKQTGMTAETRACVCSTTPWAVCSALMFKEGQAVQAAQAAQPVNWSAPRRRRLQRAAAGAEPAWLEPAELGGVMAGFARNASVAHKRALKGKKTECDFMNILGIFTERCGGFTCEFPLPPPVGTVLDLGLEVDACLPVVEIGANSMKLCTGVFETNTACTTYTAATYTAAQAASKFADDSKASIAASLCVKLGGLEKVVEWLGLDGICGGPKLTWWPVKEEAQLAQGISALIARLDVAGLLHYGDNSRNSMCNFFRNAPSKDAWNWHMKCQPFCAWTPGSGKIDISFSLNFIFWQETWTWPVVESSKPACDPAPRQCAPGQFSNRAAGDQCTACPAGTWSSAERTFSCQECPAGTYSTQTGATSAATCIKCPQGLYAPASASAQCQACPQGSFNPYEGAAACLNCPKGTYGIAAGAKSKEAGCRNAPPGSFVSKDGETSAKLCSQGTVQPLEGQSYCTKCEIESGTYAEGEGNTRCTPCPVGTFQLTSYKCTQCYPGRYQDVPGAPGMPAEKRCKPCQPGSYCNSRACTSCTPCPIGTFASGAGTITCTACPAGTVALTPGAATCSPCPAGKRYVNATTCEPCPAGTSGQDGMTCRPCLKGMYQSNTGAASCLDCPLATIAPDYGATQCTKCPDGQFAWPEFPKQYLGNEQPRTVCHDSCPSGLRLQNQSGMRRCCGRFICWDVAPVTTRG